MAVEASMYLPTIAGAIIVCAGLSRAFPALRRPVMVVAVLLVAALAFAPDIALALRVLAAVFAAIGAVVCARQLRAKT
jgi:hypothetical protein